MAANAQLPLFGVIMCCTSIPPEQRSDLASVAEQMGAVHKFDLTSDVTHLIVGDYDTPKYKFVARERSDVKVMLPSWVDAVRESWLEGEATDVEAAELKHKLPTYYGLRICVTGFDDLAFRKQLEDDIVNAGGHYSGNLTKDITHLIAKKPGSEKYEYAKNREIKTVSIEWHTQSLERGMILDELLYHPLLPVSDRGKGAWIRRTTSSTSLGKRTREDDGGSQNARKLRRTVSAKFETHNENLWTDIVKAEHKVATTSAGDWDEIAHAGEDKQEEKPGPELVNAKVDALGAENGRQELKRSQSLGGLESLLGKPLERRAALFHDRTFMLQGFEDKKATILARHLLSHGATLIQSLPETFQYNTYLLVPHSIPKSNMLSSFEHWSKVQMVTDLWVEQCLHRKHLVDPRENVTNTPLEHFPIAGFEKLKISSTGFQGIDLLHASKAVSLMGGTYYEYFTEKSSVLICNKVVAGHEKLRHASLWGIPAVKPEWLWDSIREGGVMDFKTYLIQPLSHSNQESGSAEAFGKPDKVTVAQQRESMLGPPAKPLEKPLSKPTSSKEKHWPPKLNSREGKSATNLGKSLLDRPFPDNAGPLLLPDEAEPAANSSLEGRSMESSNSGHQESSRPPLHEITPNSSPVEVRAPKPDQPDLPKSPLASLAPVSKTDGDNDDNDDTLGPAISSLLSHRQAARLSHKTTKPSSTDTSSCAPEPHPHRRRQRQLLGRVPSNLSTHNSTAKPSRASSVDTMNTDGLGTPLEAAFTNIPTAKATATTTSTSQEKAATLYDHDDSHDPDHQHTDQHLQMTQLGYADPNVAAWRERVAIKMAGGTVSDNLPTPGKGEGGKKGGGDGDGKGVGTGAAKRGRTMMTRLAAGGR